MQQVKKPEELGNHELELLQINVIQTILLRSF